MTQQHAAARVGLSVPRPPARPTTEAARAPRRAAVMTPGGRAYLAICAARHLLLGAMCLGSSDDFTSSSFEGTRSFLWFLPIGGDHMLTLWGAAFIVAGLTAAVAASDGDHAAARRALTGSVIVTALWIGGLAWPLLASHATGWSWVVVWVSLAAKDVTMLRDPLRDSVEDLTDDDTAAPDLRE